MHAWASKHMPLLQLMLILDERLREGEEKPKSGHQPLVWLVKSIKPLLKLKSSHNYINTNRFI